MVLRGTKQRGWLAVCIIAAVVAWLIRGRQNKHRRKATHTPLPAAIKNEGRYDIRRGAAGYSPVIGTFGALAVPAIIALFTFSPSHQPHVRLLFALAAGLLSVAMIASITGAIGLSAIGAERDLTANLVPATMFLAVAASVSLVAVLGAFEVLAKIFLTESKTLFAVITGVAGLCGCFFTALSIADSWHTGPSDPRVKGPWQKTQWIKTQLYADRQTSLVAGLSSVPAITGIALRIIGVQVSLGTASTTWLVSATLVLALAAIGTGAMRTRHPVQGPQRGLRRGEAYVTTLAISGYTLAMMIFLP